MATLQKFKLLATQCAVAGSPTRSPSTSPVVHLRRRKTLRMLLGRGGGRRRDGFVDRGGRSTGGVDLASDEGEKESNIVSRKLKDLFLSSSSPPSLGAEKGGEGLRGDGSSGWSGPRRGSPRPLRPLSGTLRQRLLRRAWRPVLVTIPE